MPVNKFIEERKLNQKNINKNSDIKEERIIIGKYSDAPDYIKDNEYIKNGYLINCHSLKLVLKSLFVFSNETINIWSHLIGCFISIILIILTIFIIKTSLKKELTQVEFENLKIKLNDTIIPWSSGLKKNKVNEIEKINPNISSTIDNILSNCKNVISEISNYGTKKTIHLIIGNFIDNTKILIKTIKNILPKTSNLLNNITIKWENILKNITSYFKYDIVNDIRLEGENIGKWPLFIMLSSSIVCFGFSSIFHWFLIYSKKVYTILSRLDYAGITFLIPGSCYPSFI